jgi:signal peptidase I
VPNLTGSLLIIPLPALVRFLSGLGESGDLRITRGPWQGTMVFERGRAVAAEAMGVLGEDALELMVQVLRGSGFAFEVRLPRPLSDDSPHASSRLDLAPDVLQERLLALSSTGSPLPALDPEAVPHVVTPGSGAGSGSEAQLTLSRHALAVFLDVDGRRSIAEIAARRGLKATLRSLARLLEQGLVNCAPPSPDRPRQSSGEVAASDEPESRLAADEPPRADPAAPSPRSRWRVPRVLVRELTRVVAVVGILSFTLHAVAGTFRVQGTSMQPTLSDGQLLLVNKGAYFRFGGLALANSSAASGDMGYLFGGPQRGDLVVFHAPPQPGTDYIKRIIGLPGDDVLISAGQVFVNGLPLNELYVNPATAAAYTYPADGKPLRIPADSYFVLGDNRRDSVDSHLGWLVPANELVGKTWLTDWAQFGGVPWPIQNSKHQESVGAAAAPPG